jgi:hypothetical protein
MKSIINSDNNDVAIAGNLKLVTPTEQRSRQFFYEQGHTVKKWFRNGPRKFDGKL